MVHHCPSHYANGLVLLLLLLCRRCCRCRHLATLGRLVRRAGRIETLSRFFPSLQRQTTDDGVVMVAVRFWLLRSTTTTTSVNGRIISGSH
uniref:Putative secreted protein n=1 Tax=Anopheles darlingi TaxID=43151 RepID=A0A2M4DG69_ANODA